MLISALESIFPCSPQRTLRLIHLAPRVALSCRLLAAVGIQTKGCFVWISL